MSYPSLLTIQRSAALGLSQNRFELMRIFHLA